MSILSISVSLKFRLEHENVYFGLKYPNRSRWQVKS